MPSPMRQRLERAATQVPTRLLEKRADDGYGSATEDGSRLSLVVRITPAPQRRYSRQHAAARERAARERPVSGHRDVLRQNHTAR